MSFFSRLPARASALLLGLMPAAAAVVPTSGCDEDRCAIRSDSRTLTVVTQQIRFAVPENPDDVNIVEGLNIDGYVSTKGADPTGCRKGDSVDPEGRPGIDNAASVIFSQIIAATGDAVYGLFETSIEDGTLLIMVRVQGVDDLVNDPCVRVEILKGRGRPDLGTDGSIAPDQTFGIDDSLPVATGGGYIEDGVLYAGPFEAIVPLSLLQVRANMAYHSAYLRAAIAPDGSLGNPYDDNPHNDYVIFAGAMEADEIIALAEQAGEMDHNAAELAKLAKVFVPVMADLGRVDRVCTQLSAALKLRTTTAHLLGDSF